MELTQHAIEPVRYGLNDILSQDQTPEPVITIRPVPWQRRMELADSCSRVQAVAHPDEPGRFLYPKIFNERVYNRALLYEAIIGLEHFERSKGVPLQAGDTKDMEFLLTRMGPDFFGWLIQRVLELSQQADNAIALRREDDRKNF